jgi:PAS domain S-box-containing protein
MSGKRPRRGDQGPPSELDTTALRRRAERTLADDYPTIRQAGTGPVSGSDLQKQWQELQIGQIELEMQQLALAELQQQCDQAEAGRERFAELYDHAPAGYFSLSEDGRISRANLAGAILLGCRREDLLGLTFERFVAPQAQAALRVFLAGVFASGVRGVTEMALFQRQPDAAYGSVGAGQPVAARAREVRIEANLDPVANKCRMIITDMGDDSARDTARRRALLVLDSLDEGVLVCGANRRIVSINPAFSRLTGYQAEEALGRDPRFLGLPGAHPPGYHQEAMRCLLRDGRWQGEVHNRRRDGMAFVAWMSLTLLRDDDGAVVNFIGIFSDISARKRAEHDMRQLSRGLDLRVAQRTAELTEANRLLKLEVAERQRAEAALHQSREQLRKLALHLEAVKEEERKRVAREIHDELGQNLLALRIDVSMLLDRTAARHGKLHQRAGAVLGNIDATIRSVRGIMNQLRPAVLDLGLQAAIEWQVGEFRKRSGLACTLQLPDEARFGGIAPEIEIVLFRSLQESLINVLRHAQASAVEIALSVNAEGLSLAIADNGIGIAPSQRGKSDSFGLVGIAERVGALGGSFDIGAYTAGQGCALNMRFPIAAG